jgi:hypothetical protein
MTQTKKLLLEPYFRLKFNFPGHLGDYPIILQCEPTLYQLTMNFKEFFSSSKDLNLISVNFVKKKDEKGFGSYMIDKDSKIDTDFKDWRPETFAPIFDLINNKFVEMITTGFEKGIKYEGKEVDGKFSDSAKIFEFQEEDVFIFYEKEEKLVNISRMVCGEIYWNLNVMESKVLSEDSKLEIPDNLFEYGK